MTLAVSVDKPPKDNEGACSCMRLLVLGIVALGLVSVLGVGYSVTSGFQVARPPPPIGPVHLDSPIPNVLVFIHPYDLLSGDGVRSDGDGVLAANVRHTIGVYSHAGEAPEVRMLDDRACAGAVRRVAGDRLARMYDAERVLANRVDICRGAVLYESGGLYFDTDVRARFDVRALLPPRTTFATAVATTQPPSRAWYSHLFPGSTKVGYKHHEPRGQGFVGGFVAVAPRHPALKYYLSALDGYYDSRAQQRGASGNDTSFVPALGTQLLYQGFLRWNTTAPAEAAASAKLLRQAWLDTTYQVGSAPRLGLLHVDLQENGGGCCCNIVLYDPVTTHAPFYAHAVGVPSCRAPGTKLPVVRKWRSR